MSKTAQQDATAEEFDGGAVNEQAPDATAADGEQIEGATENMPPVPDEIREAARLAPDHWLGMVDPTWNGDGPPPEWAVVGQWRSGLDGEIVEWRDNESYRPSPKALGWPDPADDVDAAVQLAATGYGPGEDVTQALAVLPEAAVFVTPAGDPLPATAPDGKTAVVPLFTSPVYLHASGRLAFELMTVPEILDRLPEDHLLYLNPSAPVSMTVETDILREALDGTAAEVTEGDTDQDDEYDVAARPSTVSTPSTPAAARTTARRPAGRKRSVEEVSGETVQSRL
ncbi:type VII secretion system-associated protein [Streptomyces fuscichromogenes]|uniref:type VII secretion system-associated protein n=1 Tax=Streptomyces fuscichromogenes TaxID=1324013 RepID=UPI0038064672